MVFHYGIVLCKVLNDFPKNAFVAGCLVFSMTSKRQIESSKKSDNVDDSPYHNTSAFDLKEEEEVLKISNFQATEARGWGGPESMSNRARFFNKKRFLRNYPLIANKVMKLQNW